MSLEPMPLFWLALTLLAYLGSRWLYRRSGRYVLSPLILVPALLLAVAVPLHTAYAEYAANTHWLMLVLGPVTVAFAIPIWQQRQLLMRHWSALLLGMLAAGVFFMGQFALFTYLRPFLETVTQVDATTLSLVLLFIGVSGLAGTAAIGWFLRKRFYGTLAIIPAVMASIALALTAAGPSVATTTALLALWGLVATAAPVGWWSWIARSLPHDAEAGGGLMVAVVQVSIALGATVGGVLFDTNGYPSVFALSAGLLLLSGFLVGLTARADRTTAIGHTT